MDPAELEREIDRLLLEAPLPAAPPTLVPCVMQAVAVARGGDVDARVRVLTLAGAIAATLAVAIPIGALLWWWPPAGAAVDAAWRAVSAGRIIWRVFEPTAVVFVIAVAAMGAACAALLAALWRVILGAWAPALPGRGDRLWH